MREHIITEIRRVATDLGRTPGARAFETRTGSVGVGSDLYRLTTTLACRSVGRTIGAGGLFTTSFTQRSLPLLK